MRGGDVFKFDDPRQARILRRLELIGPGPAAFFRDACRIMAGQVQVEAASHVVAHLLREIESAIRDVLVDGRAKPPKDARHRWEVQQVLAALGISEDELAGKEWLSVAEKGLAGQAHRDQLRAPRPLEGPISESWQRMQAVLDEVMARFEDRYAAYHAACEPLLAVEAPSDSDLDRLFGALPFGPVVRADFFGRLSHPGWLKPLRNRSVFAQPPPLVRDEEDGSIRFPHWPELAYLIRMATLDPDEVAEIALEIPDTDNVAIHSDLARLAVELPPVQAARLVPHAERWLGDRFASTVAHWLTQLLVRLADGQQPAAATELLAVLLVLRPKEGAGRVGAFSLKARLESWQFDEIRRTCLGRVVAAAGTPAFVRLVGVLAEGVNELAGGSSDAPTRSWRPSIRDCEENFESALSGLVSVVRDAAVRVCASDSSKLGEVLQTFEAQPHRIFRRLELYMLARFFEGNEAAAAASLENRDAFDDEDLENEYWALAERSLPQLPRTLEAVLEWIEQGPPEVYPPAAAEVWLLRRLTALGSALPHRLMERRVGLEARLGPVAFPRFLVSVRSGRELEDRAIPRIDEMTAAEVVQLLSEWEPPMSAFGSTRHDMGQVLAGRVAADPAQFSEAARLFRGLDSKYVSAVLRGLTSALQQNLAVDWESVLELCAWVVQQQRDGQAGPDSNEEDESDDWAWPRRSVLSLLIQALDDAQSKMPLAFRARVWAIIEPATCDPDPAEERDSRASWDPLMQLANTVRGNAMEAVAQYAAWVRNSTARETDFSLLDVREVQAVLEERLDIRAEPSVAVRAFYGRYFPLLVSLDRQWAASAVNRIFRDGGATLEAAAWETYLMTQPVFADVLGILDEHYRIAVVRLEQEPVFRWHHDPRNALGQHLALAAWKGALAEGGDDLLLKYFELAPLACRAKTLEWVGRSLRETKELAPGDWGRLVRLWEAAQARGADESLAEFGWWFGADVLDPAWRLEQLVAVLGKLGWVEADHVVVETFVRLAKDHARSVISCLGMMVDGDAEGWRIFSWQRDAQAVIQEVLTARDASDAGAARALANRLVARGRLEFQDLALGRATGLVR